MFPWIRPPAHEFSARFNIAPSQLVPVVPNDAGHEVTFFKWGLVPSWAKDAAIGNRMINARVEGIAEKPAFRAAFKRRRCLVPASGFYEWKSNPAGGKTPMYIRMKDRKPFAFAGLWETWHSPDGSTLNTCTIITGNPNTLIEPIHNRMAVILKPEHYKTWLTEGEVNAAELLSLLAPYPPELMEAYAVSRAVNNPANDSAGLIEPADSTPQPEAKPQAPRRARRKSADDSPGLF